MTSKSTAISMMTSESVVVPDPVPKTKPEPVPEGPLISLKNQEEDHMFEEYIIKLSEYWYEEEFNEEEDYWYEDEFEMANECWYELLPDLLICERREPLT